MQKFQHFEINLYFMKLNVYFNDLCAVITTCKQELHDSGSQFYFKNKLEISILSRFEKKKRLKKTNKIA